MEQLPILKLRRLNNGSKTKEVKSQYLCMEQLPILKLRRLNNGSKTKEVKSQYLCFLRESEQVYTVFLMDCTTDIAQHQIHKAAYKHIRCLSSKRQINQWLAKNTKQNR